MAQIASVWRPLVGFCRRAANPRRHALQRVFLTSIAAPWGLLALVGRRGLLSGCLGPFVECFCRHAANPRRHAMQRVFFDFRRGALGFFGDGLPSRLVVWAIRAICQSATFGPCDCLVGLLVDRQRAVGLDFAGGFLWTSPWSRWVFGTDLSFSPPLI